MQRPHIIAITLAATSRAASTCGAQILEDVQNRQRTLLSRQAHTYMRHALGFT